MLTLGHLQAYLPVLRALHDLAMCTLAGLPRGCGEGLSLLQEQLQQETLDADTLPPEGMHNAVVAIICSQLAHWYMSHTWLLPLGQKQPELQHHCTITLLKNTHMIHIQNLSSVIALWCTEDWPATKHAGRDTTLQIRMLSPTAYCTSAVAYCLLQPFHPCCTPCCPGGAPHLL